jgi:hypothetical protein
MKKNFYWEILSEKDANILCKKGELLFMIFEDDDTYRQVESIHDLRDAIDLGIEIGVKRIIS